MAFPQVEATNNSVEASATNSHTVSLPAGIQAGETLLVFFSVDAQNACTFPEGWTEIFDTPNGTNTLAVGWRKADGGEGASITVTTAGNRESVHISYRISGATDPTVTAPEVSTGATGDDTNPDPDSLTAGGGSKKYLWIAVEGNDDDDAITDYPTNYTNGETYVSSTGFNTCGIAVARRELETDVEDPGTFTLAATEQWVACTVAVYPPPGPVPVADGDLIGIGIIRKT